MLSAAQSGKPKVCEVLAVMLKAVIELAGVTLGAFLIALGLDVFLIPARIAAGGVSGIATILHYMLHLPVGATMLVLNIPLFLAGVYRLGMKFGLRSLYGTIILSFFIDFLAPFMPVVTRDPLLSSLFGGVLAGLGLGLVFRFRGSTGGTDLAAAVLRTYTGANVGQLLFLVDGLVVLAAGFYFRSWELAMYALITIFVTAWLIDLVQEGFGYAKAFFIISRDPGRMARAVLGEMNRGATVLRGMGAFSGAERDVLLVVVNRAEVSRLKELVRRVDCRAFVILTDVREVLGEGFKPLAGSRRGPGENKYAGEENSPFCPGGDDMDKGERGG